MAPTPRVAAQLRRLESAGVSSEVYRKVSRIHWDDGICGSSIAAELAIPTDAVDACIWKPPAPRSAYMIFAADHHERAAPGGSFTDRNREIGLEWRGAAPEVRASYEQRAAAEGREREPLQREWGSALESWLEQKDQEAADAEQARAVANRRKTRTDEELEERRLEYEARKREAAKQREEKAKQREENMANDVPEQEPTGTLAHYRALKTAHEDAVRKRASFYREHWDKITPFLPDQYKPRDSAFAKKILGVAGGARPVTQAAAEVKGQPDLIVGGDMYEYQLDGLRWMVEQHTLGVGGILGDEMGLGKTLQVVSFFAHLQQQGEKGPFLVVCPLSVLPTWQFEFERWCPSMSVCVFHGEQVGRERMKRNELLFGNTDVVLTTYEMVVSEQGFFSRHYYRYVVLDEAQRIKNEKTLIGQAVRKLKGVGILLITGTPLQNDMHELWALLNFLLPECFEDPEMFDAAFSKTIGSGPLMNMELIGSAHALLGPLMLRRLKKEVQMDLPPKKVLVVWTPLSEMQRFWYKRLLLNSGEAGSLVGRASAAEGDDEEDYRWKKLQNLMMQLRKICNHPFLLPGSEPHDAETDETVIQASAKMQVLHRLLIRLQAEGHRVLIYSQFTSMLDIIDDYLRWKNYRYLRLDGSTSLARRKFEIALFNQPNSKVFAYLLSTRSGALGITLTGADTVIMFDSDWNPTWDRQAHDRVHRIGQKKPVTVYQLCTHGAVEERIFQRSQQKLALNELVLRDNTTDSELAAKTQQVLSGREVRTILKCGAKGILSAKEKAVGDHSALTDEQLDEIISSAVDLDALVAQNATKDEDEPEVDEANAVDGHEVFKMRQFEGETFSAAASYKSIADEWCTAVEGRKRQSKKMLVKVNGWDVYRWSHEKKDTGSAGGVHKRQAAEVNLDSHCLMCQGTKKGEELLHCCVASCTRAMHASCLESVGLPGWGFKCPQHSCTTCGKNATLAQGLIFRCATCPHTYCCRCLPDGYDPIDRQDMLAVLNTIPAAHEYIKCASCIAKKRSPPPAPAAPTNNTSKAPVQVVGSGTSKVGALLNKLQSSREASQLFGKSAPAGNNPAAAASASSSSSQGSSGHAPWPTAQAQSSSEAAAPVHAPGGMSRMALTAGEKRVHEGRVREAAFVLLETCAGGNVVALGVMMGHPWQPLLQWLWRDWVLARPANITTASEARMSEARALLQGVRSHVAGAEGLRLLAGLVDGLVARLGWTVEMAQHCVCLELVEFAPDARTLPEWLRAFSSVPQAAQQAQLSWAGSSGCARRKAILEGGCGLSRHDAQHTLEITLAFESGGGADAVLGRAEGLVRCEPPPILATPKKPLGKIKPDLGVWGSRATQAAVSAYLSRAEAEVRAELAFVRAHAPTQPDFGAAGLCPHAVAAWEGGASDVALACRISGVLRACAGGARSLLAGAMAAEGGGVAGAARRAGVKRKFHISAWLHGWLAQGDAAPRVLAFLTSRKTSPPPAPPPELRVPPTPELHARAVEEGLRVANGWIEHRRQMRQVLGSEGWCTISDFFEKHLAAGFQDYNANGKRVVAQGGLCDFLAQGRFVCANVPSTPAHYKKILGSPVLHDALRGFAALWLRCVEDEEPPVYSRFGGMSSFSNPTHASPQPTHTPLQPTHAPVQPTHTPVQHTHKPLQPTHAAVQPTHTPVQHTHKPLQLQAPRGPPQLGGGGGGKPPPALEVRTRDDLAKASPRTEEGSLDTATPRTIPKAAGGGSASPRFLDARLDLTEEEGAGAGWGGGGGEESVEAIRARVARAEAFARELSSTAQNQSRPAGEGADAGGEAFSSPSKRLKIGVQSAPQVFGLSPAKVPARSPGEKAAQSPAHAQSPAKIPAQSPAKGAAQSTAKSPAKLTAQSPQKSTARSPTKSVVKSPAKRAAEDGLGGGDAKRAKGAEDAAGDAEQVVPPEWEQEQDEFPTTETFRPEKGWRIQPEPAKISFEELKGRTIAHFFNTGWATGVVESVVARGKHRGMYEARSLLMYVDEEARGGSSLWTHMLARCDYGASNLWVLLASD